jgi:hypothetical protein
MKQKTENKHPSPDSRSTAAFTADLSIALLAENRVSLETQSVGLTKCYSLAFVSATSLHDTVTVGFCSVVFIFKFSVVLFASSSGGQHPS